MYLGIIYNMQREQKSIKLSIGLKIILIINTDKYLKLFKIKIDQISYYFT